MQQHITWVGKAYKCIVNDSQCERQTSTSQKALYMPFEVEFILFAAAVGIRSFSTQNRAARLRTAHASADHTGWKGLQNDRQ